MTRSEKTIEINNAFDKFNARTKNLTTDTAAMYAYRWGYMETLVKEMILRSPDEERDFICKSLIG